MPCGYHIAPEDGLITIHGSNPMTLQELEVAGRKILSDPQFDKRLAQIIDFRKVDLPADYDPKQGAGAFLTKTYNESVLASIAIVVNGEQSSKSIATIYQLACSMDNAELFDDYDHAIRWLMRREFAPLKTPNTSTSL